MHETNYKPFCYVSGTAFVEYLTQKAGWRLRQGDADHGVIVAPAPHFSYDGEEIFFPVHRSHATSHRGWSVSNDQLHKSPGIMDTLAALYGGTARDMAGEISGIYEGIIGRDKWGGVRFCVYFGLVNPEKSPSLACYLPVVFTMREATSDGSVSCYGFARSESDVPEGAVLVI